MLASEPFRGAERSRSLLTFLVERTLAGQPERLKEYTVGVEALGRGASFDPRTDPIVRAEASRLRRRLAAYYQSEGRGAPLTIVLPRGGYAPLFEAGPAAAATRDGAGRALWFGLGLAMGAIGVGVALVALRPSAAPPATELALELDVNLRTDETVGSDVGTDVVISPDGKRIAFVTHDAERHSRLNERRLDTPEVTELPGTEGARAPFFSPDGRWLGFWANGAIKKVAVDGGPAVVIAEAPDLLGAAWGADDTIVAATRYGVLATVAAAGSIPKTVLDLTGMAVPAWPQLLPGGDRVLVTVAGPNDFNGPTLEVVSLRDGARRAVFHGGTFGRYIERDGHGYLLYVNQGALFALPFDAAALNATGAAFPVVDDIAYSPTFGFAQLDVAGTGTMVYRRAPGSGRSVAAWIDRAGHIEPLDLPPGRYLGPRLSPDGQSVAITALDSGVNTTLIYEPRLNRTTRLHPDGLGALAWLPDGRGLVLGSIEGLSWLRLGRDTQPQPLLRTSGPAVPQSFAPDGRLAYHTADASTHFDLWTVPLHTVDGAVTTGVPEPFLQTPAIETWPTFSPDGRWLAYGSNDSGTFEVYVRAFPDTGAVTRVSDGGGRIPTWAHNGRELLYRTDDGRVMVVEYSTAGGAFTAEKPKRWTPVALADTGVAPTFDLAPDDEHIVGLVPATGHQNDPGRNEITLIFDVLAKQKR